MGESNSAVSAYKMYRHLQKYCSHPSICATLFKSGGAEPFTKRQMLDSSELEEFVDDNFKFNENGRKFSKRVEIIVERG